jgi:hypothetical protein
MLTDSLRWDAVLPYITQIAELFILRDVTHLNELG